MFDIRNPSRCVLKVGNSYVIWHELEMILLSIIISLIWPEVSVVSSLETRLKCIKAMNPHYVCSHFSQDGLAGDVPHNILHMFEEGKFVLAGGAASMLWLSHMVHPQSKIVALPSSDIDFFILDSQREIMSALEKLDMSQWNILKVRTSASVLTFVREHDRPNIQFILSAATSVENLLGDFDLNFNRVAYVGTKGLAMACATVDLYTAVCSDGFTTPISPLRLAKASLRGFKLSSLAEEYLSNTLGWPLSESTKNNCMFKRLYFGPSVPVAMQVQWMAPRQFEGYLPMQSGNSYCSNTWDEKRKGKFAGSLEDYAKTFQYNPSTGELSTLYQWRLPICTAPFQYGLQDRFGGHNCNILQFRNSRDYYDWQTFLATIIGTQSLVKREKQNARGDMMYDIQIQLSQNVKITCKGLPCAKDFISTKHTLARATGFPKKALYRCLDNCRNRFGKKMQTQRT